MNSDPLNNLSEEMLGAFLENNLSPEESAYVADLIENDSTLSALVDDLSRIDSSIYEDIPLPDLDEIELPVIIQPEQIDVEPDLVELSDETILIAPEHSDDDTDIDDEGTIDTDDILHEDPAVLDFDSADINHIDDEYIDDIPDITDF